MKQHIPGELVKDFTGEKLIPAVSLGDEPLSLPGTISITYHDYTA